MDLTNGVVMVIMCLTALAMLVYVCFKNKEVNIGSVVDHAAQEAAYASAVFEIYDKSSATVCNRLIVVRPFDWIVWACRGSIYILNPEVSSQRSVADHTAAVRVYADRFVETSLALSYDSIVNAYSRKNGAKIKHVPYEIRGSKFTVLSALNALAKKWITFDCEQDAAAGRNGKLIDVEPSSGERSADTQGRTLTPHQLVRYVRGAPHKNYLNGAELDTVYGHLARR